MKKYTDTLWRAGSGVFTILVYELKNTHFLHILNCINICLFKSFLLRQPTSKRRSRSRKNRSYTPRETSDEKCFYPRYTKMGWYSLRRSGLSCVQLIEQVLSLSQIMPSYASGFSLTLKEIQRCRAEEQDEWVKEWVLGKILYSRSTQAEQGFLSNVNKLCGWVEGLGSRLVHSQVERTT